MPVRTSQAEWLGNLREGNGKMKVGSGAYEGAYSFGSRFVDEGPTLNPEELIAAAHAGCFSMAFSGGLTTAGFPPTRINTTARVHLERGDAGFSITKIELNTEGEVPGIDQAAFEAAAQKAKDGCPVSRALAAVAEITVNAKLL